MAVEDYRYSAYRPNAIEVEVRKDVVYEGAWRSLPDGAEAYVPVFGPITVPLIALNIVAILVWSIGLSAALSRRDDAPEPVAVPAGRAL